MSDGDLGSGSSRDFPQSGRGEQRRAGPSSSSTSSSQSQSPVAHGVQHGHPGQPLRLRQPSIATPAPQPASTRTGPPNLSHHPFFDNRRSPYFTHPAFPSFAHPDSMRFSLVQPPFPPVPGPHHLHHAPRSFAQGAAAAGLRMGAPQQPPPSYYYPAPIPYTTSQQFPSYSTPVSPYTHTIPPTTPPDWVSPFPQFPPPHLSSTAASAPAASHPPTPVSRSLSPVRTQRSESTDSAAPFITLQRHPDLRVIVPDQPSARTSEPLPTETETTLPARPDLPPRPSSAPPVFPSTAPHDARSRLGPLVPVTQPTEAAAVGPDLPPIRRSSGRRHKQTPFVLWIGNVASDATEEELYTFLSRPETIESTSSSPQESEESHICSIHLMGKANCALVNYATAEALHKAVQQFHGRRLRPTQRVRLVCRVRTKEKIGQADPAAPPLASAASRSISPPPASFAVSGQSGRTQRYFVLKSITHIDLLLSVQHGLWCTRRHNESTLNHACSSVDDVILIWGVNKSGEFFGYGRMASAIYDEQGKRVVDPSVTWPPEESPTSSSGDSHIPSGEASGSGTPLYPERRSSRSDSFASSTSNAPMYGTPFRVEWIRKTPLPFHQIRHLKNPWNGNHEIKASRDGTELPPALGQAMIDEWERFAESSN